MASHAENQNTQSSPTKPAKRLSKRLAGVLTAFMLVVASGFYWLMFTSGGLHWLLAVAAQATGGALTFTNVTGSLHHAFQAEAIAYQSDGLTARIEGMSMRWQPQDLLTGNLHVEALMMRSVEVHSTAPEEKKKEPASMPESLSLPVGIVIGKLGIRSLKTYTLGKEQPDVVLADLALRLDSDGRRHHLPTLALESEWGKIAGTLEIGSSPPFDLNAQLVFYGWPNATNGESSHAAIRLRGDLQQMKADLTVKDGALAGQGNFILHPFDALPLFEADVAFGGLNPNTFSPDFPKADLSFGSVLAQKQAGRLTGYITASNAIANPVDKEGIPLKEARMLLDLTADRVLLTEIVLRLSEQEARPGSLTGEAGWQMDTGTGQVDIRVRQLNPADLKSNLRPAKLSGHLHFEGDPDAQHGLIKLQDEALRLNMDMALLRRASLITIEKLDLARGDSSMSGHGRLQLDESQPFTFEGLLRQFDVSAFADVPPSSLNAKFDLAGQLAPKPAASIGFTIEPGHFAHQPVSGQGNLALQPSGQIHSDTRLRLGDNQLEIRGDLGLPGDRLVMTLSAPRLAQLGLGLQGDVRSRIELAGMIERPDAVFEIDSGHFSVGGEHRLAGLNARGSLHETAIQLDLQTGEYRKGTQIFLQKLSLGLSGSQAQHQLSLVSQIDQTTGVQFQARGGLAEPGKASLSRQWNGVIEKLELTGLVPVNLVSQPDLHISSDAVALGHTRVNVAAGSIDIQEARWAPGQWSTQGHFTGIALRPDGVSLRDIEHLKLGGNWQFAATRQLAGHLHIQREQGDLVLPAEVPLALGLQALVLDLQAENNDLKGQLAIRGKYLGETFARVSVPLQSTGTAWEISKNAPLKGELQLNVPDLAWIGPVLNDNVRSAGSVTAQARLAGTLEQPELQGRVTGEELVIALLDQGLKLNEGKLAMTFNQDRVQLETLSFTSPLEKPGKDRLLRNVKLSQKSGRLQAHGSLDMHDRQSNMTIELDHLPIAQQPDRWIVVSGNSLIGFKEQALAITGKIVTDVGFIKQPAAGKPGLAEDVVIAGKSDAVTEPKSPAMQVNLDAVLDLGEQFFLRASGLEGRLAGQLQLHSKPGQLLSAVGTISTRDTRFEAYGQRLQVRRGIVNFDGPLDNPGLNILAIRTSQQSDSGADSSDVIDQPSQDSTVNALAVRSGMRVEAGVEISGTVRHPKIRLVSQPEVPDSEKLSWIVLGRPADKSGLDNALLLSAAGSILGGTDEGILENITQGLGIDEFSIRQQAGGSLTSQVGTIGKRLSSRAYLSYERGLTSASTGVAKLTYSLFPHISVVTRAGDDSAVDLFYNFQFD